MQRHILSAIQASTRSSVNNSTLPLILVIGSSPLSPKEIYYLDLETPPSSSFSSPTTSHAPPSAKLLSNLERQLIRFLISTEEISDVIMAGPVGRGGGKMSLFLFTMRSSTWRGEGWRVRRGLRLNMQGLRTIRQDQDEEEGPESEDESGGDLCISAAAPHRQLLDDSRPSTPASHASHSSQRTESPGSDLTRLAEALSPARRVEESNQGGPFGARPPTRPPLVARQSSYLESKGNTSNAASKVLPALRSKEADTHPLEFNSSGVTPIAGKENPPLDPHPSSHLLEPLQSLSLDLRPPGSRLFPPNMDVATSLLARSRLGSSSSSSSSSSRASSRSAIPALGQGRRGLSTASNGEIREGEAQGGGEAGRRTAGLSTGLRTVRGRAPPRGAGFVLGCSLDSAHSAVGPEASQEQEPHRADEAEEGGDDELVLFQCEVIIPSYHP